MADDNKDADHESADIAAQLSASAPAIKTYQALIVFGLQEDFISPQGGLPVDTTSGFVQRILQLVPKFRDRAGHIVWIKSELATEASIDAFIGGGGNRVNKYFSSLDQELISTGDSDHMSPGARYDTSDFTDEVKTCVRPASDFVIEKRNCSAFTSAEFMSTLYSNVIKDVFICGAINESTLYAFARDAASRAITVQVIEDCLGYRNLSRSESALRKMVQKFEATKIHSADIHKELDAPLKQKSTADELSNIMQNSMKVASLQPPKNRLSSKISARHLRSEHRVLPSGELKKKVSRTRIYSRQKESAKSVTPDPGTLSTSEPPEKKTERSKDS